MSRDDDPDIRVLADAMVKAEQEGDAEGLERLRAQWAYACEIRDFYTQHPDLAREVRRDASEL